MDKLKKNNPDAYLIISLYGIGLAVLFAVHFAILLGNLILSQQGYLDTAQLTMDDFEWEGIEERDGLYVTTSGDPRIYLKNPEQRVCSVDLDIEFSKNPLMINVFWSRPGQDASVRRMAYNRGDDTFWLPPLGGRNLRIDTGAQAGNVMQVNSITINYPRPWYSYFIPSAEGISLLLIIPAVTACCNKLRYRFKGMLHARKAVSKP